MKVSSFLKRTKRVCVEAGEVNGHLFRFIESLCRLAAVADHIQELSSVKIDFVPIGDERLDSPQRGFACLEYDDEKRKVVFLFREDIGRLPTAFQEGIIAHEFGHFLTFDNADLLPEHDAELLADSTALVEFGIDIWYSPTMLQFNRNGTGYMQLSDAELKKRKYTPKRPSERTIRAWVKRQEGGK